MSCFFHAVNTLQHIPLRTQLIVPGYINRYQKTLSFNTVFCNIPPSIKTQCLIYYFEQDRFLPANYIGGKIEISSDHATVTHICNDNNKAFIYGDRWMNSAADHKLFKYKIKFENINDGRCALGIVSETKLAGISGPNLYAYINNGKINDYKTKDIDNSQCLYTLAGCWPIKDYKPQKYGISYGDGDIVRMIIHFSRNISTISFSVNDKDQGIAFQFDSHDWQYKLFIVLPHKYASVTLLN